jgi:hypothetical protein
MNSTLLNDEIFVTFLNDSFPNKLCFYELMIQRKEIKL